MNSSTQIANRLIGGMFGLEYPCEPGGPDQPKLPPFLSGPQIKLATARSAFNLVASFLEPRTVWVPSYLCGVVLDAFPSTRMSLRFYAVDEHLRVADDQWINEISPGDLVVFIDYFGFNQWEAWGAGTRRL